MPGLFLPSSPASRVLWSCCLHLKSAGPDDVQSSPGLDDVQSSTGLDDVQSSTGLDDSPAASPSALPPVAVSGIMIIIIIITTITVTLI